MTQIKQKEKEIVRERVQKNNNIYSLNDISHCVRRHDE